MLSLRQRALLGGIKTENHNVTLDLSQRAPDAPPTLRALHIAYPSLLFSAAQDAVTTDGTRWVALGTIRQGVSPRDRLRAPTVMEHFTYPYPLTFDLGPRRTAYHDPGRLRHDPFFELLYFVQLLIVLKHQFVCFLLLLLYEHFAIAQ